MPTQSQGASLPSSPNDPDEIELRLARATLLSAILERVGYAVWQAAECEDTLAHLVVVHLRDAKGVGEPVGLQILGKEQRRTFGSLLTDLRKHGVLEESVEKRLMVLVEERNWLVHRAKRENRGVLHDLPRVDLLVDRISRIAIEATELNSLLGAKLEAFVVSSGLPQAAVDREAAALLAEWGY